jgi:DNA uptake protein ComE-like DNA-binding protein
MTEQRKLFALLLLFIVLTLLRQASIEFSFNKIQHNPEISQRVEAFFAQAKPKSIELIAEVEDFRNEVKSAKKDQKSSLKPFPFNPNDLKSDDWLRMGFTVKEAGMIEKFKLKLEKGFEYKEQFARLYCVGEERFDMLESYILLPDKETFFASKHSKKASTAYQQEKQEKQKILIELNAADTLELTKIKGIGAYFARNIYRYREKLGGFHRKEQLLEVYRFSDSLYLKVESQVILDTSLVRKLNINQLEEKDLYAHPYFRNGVGRAIVNYRKQHGPYRNIEELNKLHALDDEKISRIKPYITLE